MNVEFFTGLTDDLCLDNSSEGKDQRKKHRSMADIKGKNRFPAYTSLALSVYFQLFVDVNND